jgi:hypothetical protein
MAEKTLKENLDDIAFKNSQVEKIKNMQEGKEKLKDSLGRQKAKVAASAKMKGLQGLQGLQGFGSSVIK